MELDAAAGPLHPVGVPLTAQQPSPATPSSAGHAQRRQVAVGEEDQSSSWPQQPGRLWQPALGVAPGAAPCSLTTRSKRRSPAELARHPPGPGEDRAEPVLQPPRGRQLLAGQVHGHRAWPRRGPARPRSRPYRTPAPPRRDRRRLRGRRGLVRDREEPPHDVLGLAHMRLGCGVGEAFVHDRPERPVQRDLRGPDVGHPTMLGLLGREAVPEGVQGSQLARRLRRMAAACSICAATSDDQEKEQRVPPPVVLHLSTELPRVQWQVRHSRHQHPPGTTEATAIPLSTVGINWAAATYAPTATRRRRTPTCSRPSSSHSRVPRSAQAHAQRWRPSRWLTPIA